MKLGTLREIESELNAGTKQRVIAEKYDVSIRTVEDISRGKSALQKREGSSIVPGPRVHLVTREQVEAVESFLAAGATLAAIKAATGVGLQTIRRIRDGTHHLQQPVNDCGAN